MRAKEMFEKLGYEYSYDDGFIEYIKGKPIPNRINTNYVKFTKISFDKLEREIFIYDYNKGFGNYSFKSISPSYNGNEPYGVYKIRGSKIYYSISIINRYDKINK